MQDRENTIERNKIRRSRVKETMFEKHTDEYTTRPLSREYTAKEERERKIQQRTGTNGRRKAKKERKTKKRTRKCTQ
jgi:hypothetical protein